MKPAAKLAKLISSSGIPREGDVTIDQRLFKGGKNTSVFPEREDTRFGGFRMGTRATKIAYDFKARNTCTKAWAAKRV
jgi:uncharacterized Rossmann fold enzyme